MDTTFTPIMSFSGGLLIGSWDPGLVFVMAGALVITFFGYRLAWRMSKPLRR